MAELDAGLELSKQKCDTTNVGDMLFVTDSSEVFVCNGKTWQTLKGADGIGKDGSSCTAKPVKDSAGLEGLEVTCGETVVGTIWNGEKGELGEPGADGIGKDGSSCTASVNKDGDFDLVCGGKSVGTIKNGANGKDGLPGADGDDGSDGESCTASVNKDGDFDLVCGGKSVGTIKNGANGNDGTSCTAEPAENETGLIGLKVTCGKTVVGTIWNGEKGADGKSAGTLAVLNLPESARGYLKMATIQITDLDLMDSVDVVQVKVSSNSDKSGIALAAKLTGSNYVAKLGFSATESGEGIIKVNDGDTVSVTYQDNNPSILLTENFVWKENAAQGYAQFSADVYTSLGLIYVYVFDENNANSTARVELTSDISPDPVSVEIPFTGKYFYGPVNVSLLSGNNGVLLAANKRYVYVSYHDSTTGTTQTDDAFLNVPHAVSLSFGDTLYYGYGDKAVVNLSDTWISGGDVAKVHVSSESDKEGRDVELRLTGSGDAVSFIGYVEFTQGSPGKDQVQVQKGDTVYVEYKDGEDREFEGRAVWTPYGFIDGNRFACTMDGALFEYDGDSYVCDADTLRSASSWEVSLNLGCVSYNRDMHMREENNLNGFRCTEDGWIKETYVECPKDGSLVPYNSEKYVCDADTFRVATGYEKSLNWGCTSYTQNQTKVQETEYRKYTWLCLSEWTIKDSTFNYGSLTDTRGGVTQTYKTIKIGNQIWMAENLNYSMRNTPCYDDLDILCKTYGRLYDWSSAISACPDDWHLPSRPEWDTLFTNVGGVSTAGIKLKSTSGWKSNGNGVDDYGFAVLPAGYKPSNADFDKAESYAGFWSSIDYAGDNAYYVYFDYSASGVNMRGDHKGSMFSVRCIKDD